MTTAWQRGARLACLIFAGEAIFSLPFHVPRFFRPTLLAEFELTNTALGDIFAVYGITAMLVYFPGGTLADRYATRTLLAGSLWATAAGGLYLATIPDARGLSLLYGYWGVTTILLFWAALIRATREWGGALAQGRAFGLLDGGRGLVAAVLASVAVSLLARTLAGSDNGTDLRVVIYFYAGVTFLAGQLCWWLIPACGHVTPARDRLSLSHLRQVLGESVLWLQAMIVVAAYCGYKGLDYYALLAQQALGLNEIDAARWVATTAYLRPIAAVVAGLCADRVGVSRMVTGLFVTGCLAYLAAGTLNAIPILWTYANLLLTIAIVYALRGVYFALLEEARVAPALTGTVVGLISVVGYTPDVFFAPLAGRLLDRAPGLAGFQHVFLLLAGIFTLGCWATVLLRRQVFERQRNRAV